MKTKTTARLTRLFAVVAAVCILACFMSTTVLAVNDTVNACANGVLQVNLVYTDDNGVATKVSSGTGFLVNDITMVTCYHVVFLNNEDLKLLASLQNKTVKEVQNHLSITITVSRDLTIEAHYLNGSAEMDFAFIKLSQALPTKTALTLRTSKSLQQTEKIWAIGFPVMDTLRQSYSTYTADDVNITGGTVTKIANGVNLYSGANTDYIQTDCNIDFGNSGGPMVDENGYVVGISQGVYALSDDALATTYYNAIAIDQVIGVGRDLGIEMNIVDDSNPTTTAPTEESQDTTTAENVAPTTTATLPPAPTPNGGMTWILIAAVAVVVIIIVVVVIVILSGGKKKNEVSGSFTPPQPPVPPQPPIPPVQPTTPPMNTTGFSAPPTFPMADAGETSVLNAGNAGETTVLSRNAVNAGTLLRKKNGESININAEQFVIGRDRKSVNYCISDNSSISRTHVKIQVRGGIAYLTDMGAANGTFVNGVKAIPRQEVELKNGDTITLADEDFEYKN